MTAGSGIEMLLCEPKYFSVEYEINPWMDVNKPVDRELAWRQWGRLRDTLVDLGVKVHLIDPAPGLPDMVFTGDGGVVAGRVIVGSESSKFTVAVSLANSAGRSITSTSCDRAIACTSEQSVVTTVAVSRSLAAASSSV